MEDLRCMIYLFVPSFISAIFVLVLLQFYFTYETDNYLRTSIKGPLRDQTQIGCGMQS